MAKLNKTCIVDKVKYSYCPHCGSDRNRPTWSSLFCSDNCHDIFEICTDFRDKVIDKNVAKEKLSKCDLSEYAKMSDGLKKLIDEIRKVEEKAKVKDTNNAATKVVNSNK